MNKKTIRWEKFRNPILPVNKDDEEESGRMMVKITPFGVEGLQFNPEFPAERVVIAHTNFDIDDIVQSTIENVDGVEILEVYSPYRMRITFGKAFNPKKVRRLITEKLCYSPKQYKFDDDSNVNIYKETIRLNSESKPWSIFILPNGKYETKVFDDEDEMEKTLLQWESIKQRIGGTILTY